MRRRLAAAGLWLASVMLLPPLCPPARALPPPEDRREETAVDADALRGADEPLSEALSLKPGEIRTLKTRRVTRVAIGNPDIVDVSIVSNDEILLQAKAQGASTVIIWDGQGQHVSRVTVEEHSTADIEEQLRQIVAELKLPDVQVRREQDKFFLVGRVDRQEQLDRLEQMVGAFKGMVTNLVEVPSTQQAPPPAAVPQTVLLTVQLIEMNRDDTEKLGVDWSDSQTFTETTFGAAGPQGASFPARVREAFRVGALTRNGVSAAVNALVTQGKARVLSEPQLVALSGKEAVATLGVEVPIITVTSVSAGTVSQNIEFKQTGVEMKFTPTVLSEDRIQLMIDAKVSSIDKTVAITVNNIQVPGFKIRHTQTEIVLDSGKTLLISGLLQDEEKKNLSQVPGVGSIPVLGRLFRSTEFTTGKTELVMIVTPELTLQHEPNQAKAESLEQALAVPPAGGPGEDARMRYARRVQDRIALALRYPDQERQRGIGGQVKLRLHVFRDGRLDQAVIAEPSGIEVLDQAALSAAQTQSPYPPFPAELVQSDLWLDLPVLFRP